MNIDTKTIFSTLDEMKGNILYIQNELPVINMDDDLRLVVTQRCETTLHALNVFKELSKNEWSDEYFNEIMRSELGLWNEIIQKVKSINEKNLSDNDGPELLILLTESIGNVLQLMKKI